MQPFYSRLSTSVEILELGNFLQFYSRCFVNASQILSMIPKEADGESFEDAIARVCRCISGGNTADNADSDSDLEVSDFFGVDLRCPILSMIPKEADGERCISGGNTADNADSEIDLEVVAGFFAVNLCCPVRISI